MSKEKPSSGRPTKIDKGGASHNPSPQKTPPAPPPPPAQPKK